MSDDVKEYMQKLKNLRVEVSTLKKELNKLNREKESWFAKRGEINKQISNLISGVKGSKDKRNEITEQVKDLKTERDTLNKEVSQKSKELNELKKNFDKATAKHQVKESPSMLKKKIEKMEYTMETQPMSFDKEQKLMKELKTLKKQYVEVSSVTGDWDKVKNLTRDISKLKRKANAAHRKIQDNAKSSQDKHEALVERSGEIDELKKEEQAAFEKFKEYKELFTEKNTVLKELLKELDAVKGVLETHNVQIEEDKKKVEQKAIKERAKEVDEKVKTGKKLTTEDLLVFQKAMNR
ncbi:hypothetical protein K9M74_02840 [Candidatus Woesearchaeota archaeon]|nr:hypothetical protein [Candidatus Woesearchaeota archaeon]